MGRTYTEISPEGEADDQPDRRDACDRQVGEVPEHAPAHPANDDPTAGVAVSVTAVESGRVARQVAPQSMPAGLDVMVPVPSPSRVVDRA